MRDECFINQPMFIFRKSIKKKKFFQNLDGIFLEQATSKRKGNEENKNDCCSFLLLEMGESLILIENKLLIQGLRIDLRIRLVGLICPYT